MRLISFLGTGKYGETTYSFDGRTARTCYVARALAEFVRPVEIQLIATDEAWAQHGTQLTGALAEGNYPVPNRVCVPTGGEAEQLWQMFARIVDALRTNPHPVMLDITHGFRMQPFFAAACIQYAQAVVPGLLPIRVVYGEYRAGAEAVSPVWELTPFLDVLSWSRALMMFLRTGRADEVVKPTEQLGRDLARQWASAGRQGPQPGLRNLARALREFSDDFTTVRTGSLLTGARPSAGRLGEAIERARHEVAQHTPALGLVLDQVQDMVRPLAAAGARLSSVAGQRALLALARLYQDMGRYSEAISVLREGWMTLGAPATADNPGPGFEPNERKNQEERWHETTPQAPTVSEVRNDIQHAGFRPQPNDRDWFDKQLATLLGQWEAAINATEAGTPD